MGKPKDYMIPILMVIAIFAVYLSLYFLPTSVFGTVWINTVAPLLWTFLPCLIILGAGVFVLLWLLKKK